MMAEVWGAAIAVVGTVYSAQQAKKAKKADQATAAAMTKEESALAAQRTGYERALDYYYNQKDRVEKQRGLDEFRKFSKMGVWSPGYTDTAARVTDPVMPQYNDFAPEDEAVDPVTGQKSKSLFQKRKDLHNAPKKALKKLF